MQLNFLLVEYTESFYDIFSLHSWNFGNNSLSYPWRNFVSFSKEVNDAMLQ